MSLVSGISALASRIATEFKSVRSAFAAADATNLTSAQSYADTAARARMYFRGALANSTAYALNDVVTYGGQAWVCTTAYTSGTTGTLDGTKWTQIAQIDMSAYAKLASPALTGTPTAPTAAAGNSSTQIATTAFVQGAQPDLSGYAPIASPTLTGVPKSVNPPGGDSSTMIATTSWVNGIAAGKANTNSPALTGSPTAPTASTGDNSTKIATTAFVQANSAFQVSVQSPNGGTTKGYRLAQIQCSQSGAGGVQFRVGRMGNFGSTTGAWADIDFSCYGTSSTASSSAISVVLYNPPSSIGTFYKLLVSAFVWEIWWFPPTFDLSISLTQFSASNCNYFGVDTANAITAPTGDMAAVTPSTAAMLASPAFTGTPTAPTASIQEDSTVLATTAWVDTVSPRKQWASSVSGGVHLADGSLSSQSTVSSLTGWGVFDWSQHKKYRIVWSANSFSNPGTSVYCRMGASGTIDTGSFYAWAASINNNGTFVNANSATTDTSWRVGVGNGETSSPSMSGNFEVLRFDRAARIQGHGIMSKTRPIPGGGFFGADYFPSAPDSVSDLQLLIGTGTANLEFAVYGE